MMVNKENCDHLVRENLEFGALFGDVDVWQMSTAQHHSMCRDICSDMISQSDQHSVSQSDYTGTRVYAGCFVAVRFLDSDSIRDLLANRSVCELGCGAGILSLVGTRCGKCLRNLVLTDGNETSECVVKENINLLRQHFNHSQTPITHRTLLWGSEQNIRSVIDECNDKCPFEIIVGCELLYYRTNIEDLVYAVSELTGNQGIFIHAHLIRKFGCGTELQRAFQKIGWDTWEVDSSSFISSQDFAIHPEWYRVRCLLSLPSSRSSQILSLYENSNIRLFEEEDPLDDIDSPFGPISD